MSVNAGALIRGASEEIYIEEPSEPLSGRNGTRIDDFPLSCPLRAWRWRGVADLAESHQVVDRMAVQDEVIRNDAAVASPPEGLRAHQCQAPIVAEANQFIHRMTGMANAAASYTALGGSLTVWSLP